MAQPVTGKLLLAHGYPVDAVFRAIGDPTRRAIFDGLTDRTGQTLFEICGRLSMTHGLASSRQAISQHLAVLEEAGLVRTRREGRYEFHDIDTTRLRSITERWPDPGMRQPCCASPSRACSSTTRPRRSPPTSTCSASSRSRTSRSASTDDSPVGPVTIATFEDTCGNLIQIASTN